MSAAIGYVVLFWDQLIYNRVNQKAELSKRVKEYSKKKSAAEIYRYKKAVGALKPYEIKNHNIVLRLKRIYSNN